MKCILFGHTWQTMRGHGEHRGKLFDVCIECNKTVPHPETEDRVRAEREGRRDAAV